jgi:hypothetical protein
MVDQRTRLPGWTVPVSIVVALVAGWWVAGSGAGDMVRLELAFTEGTAAHIIAGMEHSALRSSLLRDFAFVAAYLVAGQLTVMWLRSVGGLGLRATGLLLAAVVGVAVFDVIENVAMLIWYDELGAFGVAFWSAAATIKWTLGAVVLGAILVTVGRLIWSRPAAGG